MPYRQSKASVATACRLWKSRSVGKKVLPSLSQKSSQGMGSELLKKMYYFCLPVLTLLCVGSCVLPFGVFLLSMIGNPQAIQLNP